MRPYRDIATIAALQVICFSVLPHYEPQFFLLHLYQTIIYMALLILQSTSEGVNQPGLDSRVILPDPAEMSPQILHLD